MKPVIIVALAMGAISACAGEPSETAGEACLRLVSDDGESAERLARINTSEADFCACYDATLASRGDAFYDTGRVALAAVADVREEEGVGIDSAARTVMDRLESEENPYAFTSAEMDRAGDLLDFVQRDIRNQGSCSALDES